MFIRRMPPAVFPVIMGLFGLGLAWRRGGFEGASELLLGMTTLLWLAAASFFIRKLIKRPSVLWDDFKTFPGRIGTSAASLGISLIAASLLVIAPAWSEKLFICGLLLHGTQALLLSYWFLHAPAEMRAITPGWHLHYVGFIISGLTSAQLGYQQWTQILVTVMIIFGTVIWGTGLIQLIRRPPPPPLRPMLAIHLAPASLIGQVAWLNGQMQVAEVFAWFTAAMVAALILGARWLTVAGFSPLWGAFTFPTAACCAFWLLKGGMWSYAGLVMLVAVTAIVFFVAYRVIKMWLNGTLAERTNAAIA